MRSPAEKGIIAIESESRKEINPQNYDGCWFVYKVDPPAHIEQMCRWM